ncbi:hypothetical protein [Orrella marina]|uniref:Uncharacterized protein n=1 Tax=Orrella marina TaxID=2163011 RepID=A0A2R4XF88_9BURK|nr:hypothetical protein [Orrella marina]AWB32486.1 hypothetical protein DBV39_00755 [Orrella marina]
MPIFLPGTGLLESQILLGGCCWQEKEAIQAGVVGLDVLSDTLPGPDVRDALIWVDPDLDLGERACS